MTREELAQFCIDNPHKSPAFQFYPDNWFGSRHITMMTPEQRGIHACLIFAAWLEPCCGIPENEVCLSARVSDDRKGVADEVLKMCWFLYKNFWFSERLLKERSKQINLSKVRISTGSLGGRPIKSKIYKEKPNANQLDSKQKPNDNQTEEEEEIENEDDKYKLERSEIISYLNHKIKSNYRPDSDGTAKHINARLEAGFTVSDFKTVIDKKANQWLSDEKMVKFLRPITLFSPEHFENYLNEPEKQIITQQKRVVI